MSLTVDLKLVRNTRLEISNKKSWERKGVVDTREKKKSRAKDINNNNER